MDECYDYSRQILPFCKYFRQLRKAKAMVTQGARFRRGARNCRRAMGNILRIIQRLSVTGGEARARTQVSSTAISETLQCYYLETI